jgi:biotin carboxyl carrier protein
LEFEFIARNEPHRVALEKDDDIYHVTINDEKISVQVQWIDDACVSLIINNCSYCVYIADNDGGVDVSVNGEIYRFSPVKADETGWTMDDMAGMGDSEGLIIKAPMPGQVLKINVKEGENVEEGACLAIVEAMKMETGLHSLTTGRVKSIHAKEGQQVDAGETIIVLEAVE